MPIEHFHGLHATCAAQAASILREGFIRSPEDRYLGAGVYFYDRDRGGEKFAQKHRDRKIKYGHCAENDAGVILSATISVERDRVLDLEAEDYAQALKELQKNFWEQYNSITTMSHTEKRKHLNRLRNKLLRKLTGDLFDGVDVVKAALPCGKKNYGSGFVVYNTECICEISLWGDTL